MKAMIFTHYGDPGNIYLKEVEKPVPRENEVLIKVHASSINDWDWGLLRGTPFLNRLWAGFFTPKYRILGSDVAGHVAAAGSKVKKFHQGDEVFGDLSSCGWGGFAEYVCAREDALVLKPHSMSFEEAAAIPQAGGLALQGLNIKRKLRPGDTVLINGAGGGAGSFAIQLAKLYGAEVTAVDSAIKLELMRSMGADHVIDYTKEDFTKNSRGYDVILDMVASRSLFDYKRVLRTGGIYRAVGSTTSALFRLLTLGFFISMTGSRKLEPVLWTSQTRDLETIKELYKADKVKPAIDVCYPLHKVPEAFRYFGSSSHKGKVIITVP